MKILKTGHKVARDRDVRSIAENSVKREYTSFTSYTCVSAGEFIREKFRRLSTCIPRTCTHGFGYRSRWEKLRLSKLLRIWNGVGIIAIGLSNFRDTSNRIAASPAAIFAHCNCVCWRFDNLAYPAACQNWYRSERFASGRVSILRRMERTVNFTKSISRRAGKATFGCENVYNTHLHGF